VIQLGYLPRLQVQHTSTRDTGQIYMPFVNWSLFVMIVLAVVLFRSSSNLAAAYGIAVTLDMLITTVLTFFVIRYGWGYPLALCIAATGFFFVIDLAFFSSNLLKLIEGGWFPMPDWRRHLHPDGDLEGRPRCSAAACATARST
jgi:KUP system potassium uptake protein